MKYYSYLLLLLFAISCRPKENKELSYVSSKETSQAIRNNNQDSTYLKASIVNYLREYLNDTTISKYYELINLMEVRFTRQSNNDTLLVLSAHRYKPVMDINSSENGIVLKGVYFIFNKAIFVYDYKDIHRELGIKFYNPDKLRSDSLLNLDTIPEYSIPRIGFPLWIYKVYH